MFLQTAVSAAAVAHPLSGTIAECVWLLPVLPLAGFVINGLLSLNSAHFGPADPNVSDHHYSAVGAEALAIVGRIIITGDPLEQHTLIM